MGKKNFLVSQEDFLPFCLPRQSVVLSILSIRTPSLGSPILPPWCFSAHVSLSARSLPSSTQSNLGAKGRGSNLSGDIPSAENHDHVAVRACDPQGQSSHHQLR